jgi:hypothetical protein
MVFIASDWTPASPRDVRVFSNCQQVALHLNGHLLERRGPDRDRMSAHLAYPPFTFATPAFEPGKLEAIGYIDGREATRHLVRTPEAADRLTLWLDLSGRRPEARDDLFCHAAIRDAHGTIVPDAWENVAFGATGDATLLGANPFSSEAGIASIVLRTGARGASGAGVHALAILHDAGKARVVSAAAALTGVPAAHEIRYTTDGTTPAAGSRLYAAPVAWDAGLRAALLVGGRVVATLAADAPRFRIPISAPPQDRRTPFRRP